MKETFLSNTNLTDFFARHKLLLHVLYWVGWICFFGYIWGTYDSFYTKTFSIELIELPVKMAMVYLNLYFLMPRFLFQKKYEEFLGLSLVFLLVAGLVQRIIVFNVVEPLYWPERLDSGCFNLSSILQSIIGITTPMILPLSARLLQFWYHNQQEKQILEREKLQAELKLLKSQINPHFLFNTLNSLYALSLRKSEKTPEVVMKLSELMHYMLYDVNKAKVPLTRELGFIQNYISMEKIRYEGRFDLSYSCTGELETAFIAPMILLPFVENCFKHGVNREDNGTWITFDLRVEGGLLKLQVENSIGIDLPNKQEGLPSGIGLKNVKRRLQILYRDAYRLKISQDESSYLVQLQLSLQGAKIS